MAKIIVVDSWRKFMPPVVEHWQSLGHEVKVNANWDPENIEWADIAYFYPVENNLKVASRKQKKPANTKIIAEAVDIDIYSNHLGAVNWDYVDELIFMAEHTKQIAAEKGHLPSDVPIHVVPGGVDLNKWTLRKSPERGHNIAWIGRLWIGKNVFGALQIFHRLIRSDPNPDWKLFLRGENYHPLWWRKHVEAYLEANPNLAARVEFVPRVASINDWLEDKDYLLQVSFKEALGYCVVESAAKGIKPIIQMTNGALATWPSSWIFQTHEEAVQMFLSDHYEPETYRAYIADQYPLFRRLEMLDEICGLA